MTGVISDALLVAGLVIVVCSCAGMAVFDDPLDRLHLVTPAAMLGSTGICASIVVRYGLSSSGLAAIGVAAILIAANPLTGHAVARAIAIRRGALWSDSADDAAAPSGDAAASGDEQ
jgi:multisubunit Na+/H+ antiporter MnhG subunit